MSRTMSSASAAFAAFTLPVLLLTASCASREGADRPTEEAIELAAELEDLQAGEPQRCISTFANRSMQIVDEDTLVYRDGRTLYVNRLETACPGMRPQDVLVVRPVTGSRLCRLDTIEPRDRGAEQFPGPRCALGDFTPYRAPADEEQEEKAAG